MGSVGTRFPTPAVSITKHPATLPRSPIDDDIDKERVAAAVLPQLLDLTAADLTDNAIWRDSLALTGTFRTFFSGELVANTWRHLCKKSTIQELSITAGSAQILRFGPEACWLQASFSFRTQGTFPSVCSGTLGLVPHGHSWKIWLITTILEQPLGFPDVDKLEPGPADTDHPGCLDCIVIGAGLAGLDLAGRLKSMGLSYMVLEKSVEVGDVWSKHRYDSVKMHTSRDYNQLPGLPKTFTKEDYPYYLGSDDLARGFKSYVKTFGINVTTSTRVDAATYDAASKTWTISAEREGTALQMSARHLVLATGSMGTRPVTPSYMNHGKYQGHAMHSIYWKNAKPWKGKRGVVIGSANSAHDIIADMVSEGFTSVTLVQRSKTWVLPASTFGALVDPVFNPDTPSEVSDRILLGNPLPIQRLIAMEGIRACADKIPEYFERLEAKGFKTERYGDLWGILCDREGGHFFDVGSGELIAEGKVKVKSNALPVAYTESGLSFEDETELDADVIVFATGYKGDMKENAKRILGEEVGESLEEFWQCDQEGEIRGAWRDTGRKLRCVVVQFATPQD